MPVPRINETIASRSKKARRVIPHEWIAILAYEIWNRDGQRSRRDFEHWLEAERTLSECLATLGIVLDEPLTFGELLSLSASDAINAIKTSRVAMSSERMLRLVNDETGEDCGNQELSFECEKVMPKEITSDNGFVVCLHQEVMPQSRRSYYELICESDRNHFAGKSVAIACSGPKAGMVLASGEDEIVAMNSIPIDCGIDPTDIAIVNL